LSTFVAARDLEWRAALPLQTDRVLAAPNPSNADKQRSLSVSHESLGAVQAADGELAHARGSYEDGLWIAKQLPTAEPSNAHSM
jgi:hypothetical protein